MHEFPMVCQINGNPVAGVFIPIEDVNDRCNSCGDALFPGEEPCPFCEFQERLRRQGLTD